jgi:hypothetical protein
VNLAQLVYPFYGFDPRSMDLYSPSTFTATSPGTPLISNYPGNPNQVFTGTLIFEYPTNDSMDYVRAGDIPGTPFFPLGLVGVPVSSGGEQTHSTMLKSVSDRMESWSSTLGFSGGVEGLLTLGAKTTLASKMEDQETEESRYTISRKFEINWLALTDEPSLQLHSDLVAEIRDLTMAVLNGKSPEYDDFVTRFGTHYAHAITQGSIELAETRFTLTSESTADTESRDLTLDAKVVIDGAEGGTNDEFKNEWKVKTGLDVSTEDITVVSVGEAFPVGIFYDLRPISELLNPVLCPYNPADDWQQCAPWVWLEVRRGLDAYLKSLGLDSPIDSRYLVDYTPQKFRVTFPTMSFSNPNGAWVGLVDAKIAISAASTPSSGNGAGPLPNQNADPACVLRAVTDLDFQMSDPGVSPQISPSDPYKPSADQFSCTVMTKAGPENAISFKLQGTFLLATDGDTLTFSFDEQAELSRGALGDPTPIEKPVGSLTAKQGDWTLQIQIQAEKLDFDFADVPPKASTAAGGH